MTCSAATEPLLLLCAGLYRPPPFSAAQPSGGVQAQATIKKPARKALKVRKPTPAFLFFSRAMRDSVMGDFPDATINERTKIVNELCVPPSRQRAPPPLRAGAPVAPCPLG